MVMACDAAVTLPPNEIASVVNGDSAFGGKAAEQLTLFALVIVRLPGGHRWD